MRPDLPSTFYLRAALALACTLAGCDSQFSPGYLGEPLLTVSGMVEISENRTEGPLLPALAFVTNDTQGRINIMETAVKGEFPSNFRLDVYEEPLAEALYATGHGTDDEPRIAFAYITAVSQNHPESLRFATTVQLIRTACGLADASRCPSITKWCTYDQAACYQETMVCPEDDSPAADCHIEAEGDPELQAPPWHYFAGFSQNYVVVYLEKAAAAGSWTATLLGSPDGLPKGYSLFAVRVLNDNEQRAADGCLAQADALATAHYNTEHSTNYPSLGAEACLTCAGPAAPDGSFPANPTCEHAALPAFCAGGTEEEANRWQRVYDRYHDASNLELGCPLSNFIAERVIDPGHGSISVRVAPDAAPQFLKL